MNLTPDMGAKPEGNRPATSNLYTIMYTVFLLYQLIVIKHNLMDIVQLTPPIQRSSTEYKKAFKLNV